MILDKSYKFYNSKATWFWNW